MVYHAIVRSQLLNVFDEFNKGNCEPILSGFAPQFEHRFYGKHALGGLPFRNQGVHVVHIRYGKVTGLRIYCDTQVLQDALQRNASHGIEEALAAPIED